MRRALEDGADPSRRIPGQRLSRTPLFLSVDDGSPAITRILLEAGANPSVEDDNGDPVMVAAADAEHLLHARILIEHGVGINSRNSEGITCLIRTAPYDSAENIAAILELGADPDLRDPAGRTALMRACEHANIDAVGALLKGGAKPNLTDKEGHSALMIAVNPSFLLDHPERQARVVRQLLQGGARINQTDPAGRDALLLALSNWQIHPTVLEALLEAGPDLTRENELGRSALHLALTIEEARPLAGNMIELGADFHTTDRAGVDLLMTAAFEVDPVWTRRLLELGLSPNRQSRFGDTAVHSVASARPPGQDPFSQVDPDFDDKVAEIFTLLDAHGASLTTPNHRGSTPLHLAAAAGNIAALRWLVEKVPTMNPVDAAGRTPLHLAAMSGSGEALEYLLDQLEDPSPRDHQSRTPLALAVMVDRPSVAELLVAAGAVPDEEIDTQILSDVLTTCSLRQIRFLARIGVDFSRVGSGDTHLLAIARLFHERPLADDEYAYGMQLLAPLASNINVRDSSGRTALMWAASSGVLPALGAVLAENPELDLQAPDGRTALMWAACARARDGMKVLLDAGADPTLRDAEGRSADDWLTWFDHYPAHQPDSAAPGRLLERIHRSRTRELHRQLEAGGLQAADRVAGVPALHLAAALGDLDSLEALLSDQTNPDLPMEGGITPLMEAAANGCNEVVEVLLKRGASPRRRDDKERRAIDHAVALARMEVALHLARLPKGLADDEIHLIEALVRARDPAALERFLAEGAAILPPDRRPEETDPYGRPAYDSSGPLRIAASNGDLATLKVLANHPSATGAAEVRPRTLALHQAAERGDRAVVRYLVDELHTNPDAGTTESLGGVVTLATAEVASTQRAPEREFTPLTRAIERGHDELIGDLLKRQVPIRGRTRSTAPPLSFAVIHGHHQLLRQLLAHNPDCDLVNHRGRTALHEAADRADTESVSLLLAHGADPDVVDHEGSRPLDLARQAKAEPVVELLVPVTTPPSGTR